MKNFIKSLNAMFEANSCTNNGRVIISLNGNEDVVTVHVLGKNRHIIIDGFTDYGLLVAIMKTVDKMYNRA